jgi:hypothetical protein
MLQLNLYSTSHCHLCEQAEALLTNLSEVYDIHWQVIEISENHELLENYGQRIPVIKRLNNNIEINWPFTATEIAQLITA